MRGPLYEVARFEEGGYLARKSMKETPYYDPPLAAQVSRLLGPGFQHGYHPKKKRYLRTEIQPRRHGMYVLPTKEDVPPFFYPYRKDDSSGEKIYDILTPEADTVYTFGPTPDASVMAHEFRHRAGIHDERTNRLFDGMYAETPADWNRAVEFWQDYNGFPSRDIAERNLVNILDSRSVRFRGQEWDAAPEDAKPEVGDPSVGGWLTRLVFGPRGEFARYDKLPYKKFKKAHGGLASLSR